jgi:PEGA domain
MRRLHTRLLILGWLVVTAPAAAAPPDAPAPSAPAPLSESLSGAAREAYEAARILVNNQDPAGALTKYLLAYDLSKDPRLLFDMAVCERDLRAYARMQALLVRYEQEAGASLSPAAKADVDAALDVIRNLVGTVRLSSTEAGATVAVDGEPAGSTPLANPLLLDLGKHRLSVTKAGFDPVERAIEIAGGNEIAVSMTLVATVHLARLLVVVGPGATVILDRKAVARGRFDGAVSPGIHEVQVTAPGKKPYETSTDLRDGETRTLEVTLEDERRGLGVWPWLAGGVVVAAGAVVGGYFLLKPHDEQAPVPMSSLPPVMYSGIHDLR